MKFKAVIDQPDLLRDSINAVSTLINEAVFKVTKSGIELRAMDSANVSMVEMRLLASAFRSFDVDKETEIAVNIGDLTSVLKRAKSTDSLTLELKDNQLHIEFSGET
ncbi:TPA: DNA polymerase sliding clamp, partial [archaeon]|nr:DNA polymerase sliding clamp [Candidatus Naiadarchaeales archaeon SRR2090153.bin1042]